MIDTVKLLVPIGDPLILRQIEGSLMRIRKDDLKTGEVKFEFFTANLRLGSHKRNVTLKSTQVPHGLFVECSYPKYEKGNNVEMIYPHELPGIAARIYTDLCSYLNYTLPPVETWEVYRLDICYNWIFASEAEVLHAIDFIKRIDYPRKTKRPWDTSVMFQGSAYVVKFYAKGAEFKKHDFKELIHKNVARTYSLQAWADHIVRFEVGMKHQYLMQFFKHKKIYLAEISDDSFIEDTLQHFLGKVFQYVNPKATSLDEVRQVLNASFTRQKALRLYQFYKGYYLEDETKDWYLKGGLNRTTMYRYKKDLQALGIGFVMSGTSQGKGVLEQLIIPSASTKFALPDSLDIMRS